MTVYTFNPSIGEDEAGGLPLGASLGYIVRTCTQAGDYNLGPFTPDLGLLKSFGYPPKSFAFPKQGSGEGSKLGPALNHPRLWKHLASPDSPVSNFR